MPDDGKIADHLRAVRDRRGQVGQHPAPVMDQQPPRDQRLRQAPEMTSEDGTSMTRG